MDEERVVKNAKARKTLNTITKVFMYVVLAVIISFAIILVCAESGIKPAQNIMDWFSEKYGIVVGVGTLGGLLFVLKALMTVWNTTSSNEVKQEETLAKMIEINDSINNTLAELKTAQESIAATGCEVTSRNELIDSYKDAIAKLGDQQAVLFETMKLFVTANTNDAKIKAIFKDFEETQLFAKAKALYEKDNAVEEVVTPEVIESAKEAIEKAKEIVEPIANTVKSVRTIIRK